MKRLLLDTHVILWWLNGGENLKSSVRDLLSDVGNQIYFSAASVWEISIKKRLGKLDVPENVLELIDESGFDELAISSFHAFEAGALLTEHKDPFDRMLIAQAQAEGLILITHDTLIYKYGIRCLDPI